MPRNISAFIYLFVKAAERWVVVAFAQSKRLGHTVFLLIVGLPLRTINLNGNLSFIQNYLVNILLIFNEIDLLLCFIFSYMLQICKDRK